MHQSAERRWSLQRLLESRLRYRIAAPFVHKLGAARRRRVSLSEWISKTNTPLAYVGAIRLEWMEGGCQEPRATKFLAQCRRRAKCSLSKREVQCEEKLNSVSHSARSNPLQKSSETQIRARAPKFKSRYFLRRYPRQIIECTIAFWLRWPCWSV